MSTKGLFLFVAGIAMAAGCRMPVDRGIGAVVGDVNGVTYKEQYSVHNAYSLSLGYTNPRDWDGVALQADLVSFGRIPEASQTTIYVGVGAGAASWTADSPTGRDANFWLRLPFGVLRRFALDNGEVFFELAATLGLDHYDSVIGWGGGVRWKIGM